MKRRGVLVEITGSAVLRVQDRSRLTDGTLHLEIVRVLALGCKHLVIDLGGVRFFDDTDVSDIVSWYYTISYKKGDLRLINVCPSILKKLAPTAASATLERKWQAYTPPRATLRLAKSRSGGPPADTAVHDHPPAEDWLAISGYLSLGQWARLRRKRSH
jgi:hypothetical protein